ncbi:MAG TPA: DUF4199 family protein [Sphingobacterium sp.]|nr:DUF4199 family protein [Sphingobacterium sp.]
MSNELSREEKRDGLIYGALVGIITIVLSIISIYLTRSITSYSSLFITSTILKVTGSIFIPVLFVYLLRKKNGHYWTFSRALKSIYILLASSIIISSLGITIWQKNMDKIVLEESYHNLMNLKIVDMESKGASEKEIDQQIEVIEQDKEFALSDFSIRNAIAPMFISLLLNFVFAMLLALLFRTQTNDPMRTKP